MPIGLFANPISMIFSLLLMQGLSLTMFRALVNQAISRNDPLKFNLNLGNNNLTHGLSLLSNSQPVPTPAPIVDPRMLELVQLIRAITPTNNGANNNANTNAPTQAAQVASLMSAPIMSAPILALPSATTTSVQHQSPPPQSLPASYPQIIILPQYPLKTSSSTKVETVVKKEDVGMNRRESAEKELEDQFDDLKKDSDGTLWRRLKTSNKLNQRSKKNLIVFEAVGLKVDHNDEDSQPKL